jgi:hypothetical protein
MSLTPSKAICSKIFALKNYITAFTTIRHIPALLAVASELST